MIKHRPFFVAIVGGSGSGKSWLAESLAQQVRGHTLRISLDDFYRDRSALAPTKRARLNFDNPRAIDWPLFRRVIKDLRQGRPTLLPIYDFATHCRGSRWRRAKPRDLVLVEGLWLLHSANLRRHFDFAVFLDCCEKTRLTRRLQRDVQARGRTRESVLEQFQSTVQPMHKTFVEPQKRWAAIVLKERFSGRDIVKMANLIRDNWRTLSSAGAPKRGNTR